jgi:hypothetical protein
MSQWSESSKVIGKARFLAHIDSAAFQKAATGRVVDDIVLLDDGGDRQSALAELARLKALFVGKPYSDWATLS